MIISTIFRNRTTQKILRVVVPLAFWLGAWQLAAIWVDTVYTPGHGALLLPSPLQVWERLAALAARPSFWRTAAVSLGRIFGGFALGAAVGTLLAVITSALSWADWLFRPMVKVIRAVPVASFIVLVLLWASTGRVPAIVSGLMVLPVLWGNVCKGISQTDGQLLEAARAYRFGRWKTLRLVYVPSVLPYFASGCATGLGLAWKAGVAAEVLCQPRLAIGTQVYRAKITLETPDLFAWTAVVIALSFLLEYALGLLFRRHGAAAGPGPRPGLRRRALPAGRALHRRGRRPGGPHPGAGTGPGRAGAPVQPRGGDRRPLRPGDPPRRTAPP